MAHEARNSPSVTLPVEVVEWLMDVAPRTWPEMGKHYEMLALAQSALDAAEREETIDLDEERTSIDGPRDRRAAGDTEGEMKSQRTIQRRIKELRQFIDASASDDSLKIERRIAYEVESALRWAVLRTVGWETPLNSAL